MKRFVPHLLGLCLIVGIVIWDVTSTSVKSTDQALHGQTACINNLKQIGHAAELYALDSEGWMPPIAWATVESNVNNQWYPGDRKMWLAMMSPYMKGLTPAVMNCPVDNKPYRFTEFAPRTYGTGDGVFKLNIRDPANPVWLKDTVDIAGATPVTVHGNKCNAIKADGSAVTLD